MATQLSQPQTEISDPGFMLDFPTGEASPTSPQNDEDSDDLSYASVEDEEEPNQHVEALNTNSADGEEVATEQSQLQTETSAPRYMFGYWIGGGPPPPTCQHRDEGPYAHWHHESPMVEPQPRVYDPDRMFGYTRREREDLIRNYAAFVEERPETVQANPEVSSIDPTENRSQLRDATVVEGNTETAAQRMPGPGNLGDRQYTPGVVPSSWYPLSYNEIRRQGAANRAYSSNVLKSWNKGNNAMFTIGTKLVIKDRKCIHNAPLEGVNNRFVSKNTSIPIPEIIEEFIDEAVRPNSAARYFLIEECVKGSALSSFNDRLEPSSISMSHEELKGFATEAAAHISKLREMVSPQMSTLDSNSIVSNPRFLKPFCGTMEVFNIPTCHDEVFENLALAVCGKIDALVLKTLHKTMPACEPFTFSHGDFVSKNVIVQDDKISGILDWKMAGYYPVWWEYVAADRALREAMPESMQYPDALEWWTVYEGMREGRDAEVWEEAWHGLLGEMIKLEATSQK